MTLIVNLKVNIEFQHKSRNEMLTLSTLCALKISKYKFA